MRKTLFCFIILIIFFIITSCENDLHPLIHDEEMEVVMTYPAPLEQFQPITTHANYYANTSYPIIFDEIFVLHEESLRMSEHIFTGGGESHVMGGDELHWYTFAFGAWFDVVPLWVTEFVGWDEYIAWVYPLRNPQYTGRTAFRTINLRTFVEDFGISMREFIQMKEIMFGLPMHEMDSLINWRRYGDLTTLSLDELHATAFWEFQYTIMEIEAIFSNNIEVIWAAFPGHGIMYNGRVYSPEWILNNIEQAVFEELLPMEEIARVIELTVDFAVLDDVRASADVVFQAGLAVR